MLCIYEYFACMDVHASHGESVWVVVRARVRICAHMVLGCAQKRYWLLWNCNYGWLYAITRVLGTESGPFVLLATEPSLFGLGYSVPHPRVLVVVGFFLFFNETGFL